jgi:hypothetical protein
MNYCKNCQSPIELGQAITWENGIKIHEKCQRKNCSACGCVIYPEQATYPRKLDVMHVQCGNEAERIVGFLIRDDEQVPYEPGFALNWPSRYVSDEWKDFWMECRKHDRAEIDKARSRT